MLLLARTLRKSTLKWLDWETCVNPVTQHFWPDFYDQRCIGSLKVSLSKSQVLWDLEFLNGHGCKILTEEKKGQQYQEMLLVRLFSRTTFPGVIGSSVAYLGNTAQCQLTRTGKRTEVTKIIGPVEMSLIQVRLWVKCLLESPAILTLSSKKQPTFLKSLIFQANFIQLSLQLSCEVEM